jgi:hypothetical protein
MKGAAFALVILQGAPSLAEPPSGPTFQMAIRDERE